VESIGGMSLANRARQAILHSILERRFKGSRLPPENELAEMLGVSRTTVRSALQSLEQHGVLTRTRGRGTLVHGRMSPSMIALQRLVGFARLLEEHGYTVEVTTKLARTAAPPPEAIEAHAIPPGAACYRIDRLMFASGEPATWAIDFFAVELFTSALSQAQVAKSPFDMGEILIGGPIDHAIVELLPSRPSPQVAKQLALKQSDAYLMLKEIHFSEAGIPLGYSLIHVNDRFVRFQLLRRGNGT
jgi:GntR family transcriptional regulator